jgi:hypothetical protein
MQVLLTRVFRKPSSHWDWLQSTTRHTAAVRQMLSHNGVRTICSQSSGENCEFSLNTEWRIQLIHQYILSRRYEIHHHTTGVSSHHYFTEVKHLRMDSEDALDTVVPNHLRRADLWVIDIGLQPEGLHISRTFRCQVVTTKCSLLI